MIDRFEPTTARTLRTCIASAALIVLLTFTSAAAVDDPLLARSFAGAVDGELFIGILVADHPPAPGRATVVVYLCDGADVASWAFEEVDTQVVEVSVGDATVALTLGEDAIDGVVERAGVAPAAFVAEASADDAGLFRGVQTFDGEDYVGGWIVLNDGAQRGAITLGGSVLENPTLDPVAGRAAFSLGTFGTNCFRNPHTGERICRYMLN